MTLTKTTAVFRHSMVRAFKSVLKTRQIRSDMRSRQIRPETRLPFLLTHIHFSVFASFLDTFG